MNKTYLIGGMVIVIVLLAGGWYYVSTHTQKKAAETSATLANPASTYCVNLGGQVSLAEEGGTQVGYCHLSDGRVCEEWALFNNKTCSPPGASTSVSASTTIPLPSMENIKPR